MVTICTASLTFNNSTFCPHGVFMCFVWISEQTAIISIYSINWLVFITEAVFTARYGLGHIIQVLAVGWDFVPVLPIFPSVPFHKRYTLIFATLRSYQDKQSKPGEHSKRNALSEIGEHWIEKYCHFIFKVFRDLGTLMCSNWAAQKLEKCGERK